jgi:hypothetical protein
VKILGGFPNNIFVLEQELNRLVESDISNKTESLKIFENLNSEKPTPLFLNLTKNRSCAALEGIRNPDGSVFTNETERHNYIFRSYQNLFRARDRDPLPETAVEDFLGPEIANSDLVNNSKLSNAEAEALEAPLTITELDDSVKKSKMRSAPGMDGYSNLLIQRCWKFLRYPLLNYCNACYNSGQLTHNFKSARIRLIPKKGDTTQLKNWRPISLLSNLY